MDFETFLQYHQAQLESSQIPSVFWRTIFTKVTMEVFNTGDYFSIEKIEYESEGEGEEEEGTSEAEDVSTMEVSLNGDSNDAFDAWACNSKLYESCEYRVVVNCDRMEPDDPENVFLIDHMITFEELSKRKSLIAQSELLVERLCTLVDLKESESLASEQKIQVIEHNIFKYLQSYCLNDYAERGGYGRTVWYILDEFGCRIGHSFEPTFRCVPFTYLHGGISYNLLFPVKYVVSGDLVTRNYIESASKSVNDLSAELKAALMLPWEYADLTEVDYSQVECLASFAFKHKPEEVMPDEQIPVCLQPTAEKPVKVYSQYKYVNEYLTDARFQLVENRDEADILWLLEPFYGYKELAQKGGLVNQFPFESVLTVKDLFAIVCRRARTSTELEFAKNFLDDASFSPAWLMPTFDLQSELPQFVSYYQNRQAKGGRSLDNTWIVKPWNLSRGLETVITANLVEIVKLRNALPKVVCKYIDRPVLFKREDISASVKFDLRFIVLLRSVRPLRLYVYRNFWIRFANKNFSVDELEDYEKHFTVMNYTSSTTQLKQMFCSEFIGLFDAQYGKGKWSRLQADTFSAIKAAFECATLKEPPAGIGQYANSRGLYGIDVMPRWMPSSQGQVMQPTLLEVNWMPDCKRACEYYPTFFNEVFATLFTDQVSENMQLL